MDPTTATTIPTTPPATTSDPVQRFVDAIAAGTGMPTNLFAEDAVLDATVPNWRYETTGAAAIGTELSKWYGHPAAIERSVRRSIPGGVAIELDFSWEDGGVPHASHQLHLLTIDSRGEHLTADTAFCGGRWSADLLAEMEAARAH